MKWRPGFHIVGIAFLMRYSAGLTTFLLVHSSSVIHGDLTGVSDILNPRPLMTNVIGQSNVLLDESAKSCICDFGLSTLIAEVQDTSSNSCVTGAVRWTAPELYKIEQDQDGTAAPRPTVYSDIFSYGRVMLQVSTFPRSQLLVEANWHWIA